MEGFPTLKGLWPWPCIYQISAWFNKSRVEHTIFNKTINIITSYFFFLFVTFPLTEIHLSDDIILLYAKDFAPKSTMLYWMGISQRLHCQPDANHLLAAQSNTSLFKIEALLHDVSDRWFCFFFQFYIGFRFITSLHYKRKTSCAKQRTNVCSSNVMAMSSKQFTRVCSIIIIIIICHRTHLFTHFCTFSCIIIYIYIYIYIYIGTRLWRLGVVTVHRLFYGVLWRFAWTIWSQHA